MMRLIALGCWALLLLHATAVASVDVGIPVPFEEAEVKFALWRDEAIHEEMKVDRELQWQLRELLRNVGERRLKALFYPEQAFVPPGYVLPVHHHAGVGFSGMGYVADGASYFLGVGDIGGVLVFPYGAHDSVSAAALYLKVDSAFVPLRSRAVYARRRRWELERMEALRRYILFAVSLTLNESLESGAVRGGQVFE